MLDTRVRRALAPTLDAAAGALDRGRVHPLALTGAGWLVGVAACLAAAQASWTAALVLWLLNRLLDGLDGPVARRRGATDLGGFLDVVADFSIYAGFVVAVAVAVPGALFACLVLLTTYYLSGTAFLALSSIIERRGRGWDDGRSLRFVGGLAEGTETVVAYLLICLFPDHATAIVWVFAAAVLVTAGQRVALGVVLLRAPVPDAAHPSPDDASVSSRLR